MAPAILFRWIKPKSHYLYSAPTLDPILSRNLPQAFPDPCSTTGSAWTLPTRSTVLLTATKASPRPKLTPNPDTWDYIEIQEQSRMPGNPVRHVSPPHFAFIYVHRTNGLKKKTLSFWIQFRLFEGYPHPLILLTTQCPQGSGATTGIPKDPDLRINTSTILNQFQSAGPRTLPSGGICLIDRCCGPHPSFLYHLTLTTGNWARSDIWPTGETIHKPSSNLYLIWSGFKKWARPVWFLSWEFKLKACQGNCQMAAGAALPLKIQTELRRGWPLRPMCKVRFSGEEKLKPQGNARRGGRESRCAEKSWEAIREGEERETLQEASACSRWLWASHPSVRSGCVVLWSTDFVLFSFWVLITKALFLEHAQMGLCSLKPKGFWVKTPKLWGQVPIAPSEFGPKWTLLILLKSWKPH